MRERRERGEKTESRWLLMASGFNYEVVPAVCSSYYSLGYCDGKRLGENGSRLAPRTAVLGV